MNQEDYWKQRRITIWSKDEYGSPFEIMLDLPAFFQNRPTARLDKVELIDQEENILQTLEDSKKKIETRDAFQTILTSHELRKNMIEDKKHE